MAQCLRHPELMTPYQIHALMMAARSRDQAAARMAHEALMKAQT